MKTIQPQIMRPKDVADSLGVSMATFWRLVKDKKIKTVKISPRCTGVLVSEHDRFVSEIGG